MRIFHTSDWHLGQELHELSRDYEHDCFLSWLIDRLDEHRADALIVSGDIFDTQNPGIQAQRALYAFLREAKRRLPDLDIVLTGGNHDSAGRLEAPRPLLGEFGVHVVGSLPRLADGGIDLDRLLVPLHDAAGKVAAWCVAVPFLRLSDLPQPAAGDEAEDALIWGVQAVYDQALAGARHRRGAGQALVATGHCYMVGGALSELSERRILGGNQHALPAAIFPADVDYVALGHLHKPQRVGGCEHIRYSGSPFPLSVSEKDYNHQVVMVDFIDGQRTITPLPVPRAVDYLRVPAQGAGKHDEVLAALRALEAEDHGDERRRPYLEVAVALDRPHPGLRREVEDALAGKTVRLVKLAVAATGNGEALAAMADVPRDLAEMQPEDVFVRCYRRDYDGEPSEQMLSGFRELLEAIQSGDAAEPIVERPETVA